MLLSKEHLTEAGRLKIRAIASEIKKKNNKYNTTLPSLDVDAYADCYCVSK